ncbi:MAG TPA: dephospho-CoA kinase [Candidatus Binatia bacterium]|nr:dephospho-CoA kinase [Candidatus Binatia bacterium]
MRVGLTGGIGCGKSTAGAMFAELGAVVTDADQLAHEVVEPGTPGFERVAARWPAVVRDGRIDRAALAGIVFSDAQALRELEAIVHPLVRAREAELEKAAAPGTIVIHDIPLLFESGFYSDCDKTVLIYAPAETRIARVTAREGWSREAIEKRMEVQIDQDDARGLADFVIENDRDLPYLREQIERVYEELRQGVAR